MNTDEHALSKDALVAAAAGLTGGDVANLATAQVKWLMTITQHVTDLCLNEIERRGELTFHEGAPVLPYISDHIVPTILTR